MQILSVLVKKRSDECMKYIHEKLKNVWAATDSAVTG